MGNAIDYEHEFFLSQRQQIKEVIQRPGRFERCSMADYLLWAWLQDADGETVEFPDGSSETLIEGSLEELQGPLTYNERKQLIGCVGAILMESSKGLIRVFWYHDKNKLDHQWETAKRSAENAKTDPEFGWGGG